MTADARGYTLLELLMVLFIIGLSVGAVFSLGLGASSLDQSGRLERFDYEYRLMTQSAVLEGHTWGLDFHSCGEAQALCWRWLEQDGAAWRAPQVLPGDLESIGQAGFAGSAFELRIDGLVYVPQPMETDPAAAGTPEAFVYPTRETSPLSLRLNDGQGGEGYWHVDGMGRSGSDATLQAPL